MNWNKLYLLRSNPESWHKGITFFHRVMFHGEALLPEGRKGIASHDLEEETIAPMQIIVNAYDMPEIFCPIRSCNLIVSSKVRRKILDTFSNIVFAPVQFHKVYSLPWTTQEILASIPDNVARLIDEGHQLSIPDLFDNNSEAAATIGDYYELIAPNHYDLLDKYEPTHQFFMSWYEEKPLQSDLLPVSRFQFQETPITNAGFPVIREDFYSLLLPFLNTKMFGIKEFDFESNKSRTMTYNE